MPHSVRMNGECHRLPTSTNLGRAAQSTKSDMPQTPARALGFDDASTTCALAIRH
jgi:hypothetical protein